MSVGTLMPELARAVKELEEAFPARIAVEGQDDAVGGAVIRLRDVPLCPRWSPETGDLLFVLPFHYPDAPIYPAYVDGATPTGSLVPALQPVNWRGMAVTQVSLRHNAWDPVRDTAVGSALQTMSWLRAT